MIPLHCTKKLLTKLPLREDGYLNRTQPGSHVVDDSETSPLGGWHGNLVLLQRRQCVLLVHDQTRFPVFLSALTKPDFANLDQLFVDGFMNTLLKCGADERLMARAHAALGPLKCDTVCDRSVQGTLNHMKQDLDQLLRYERVSVVDLSAYRTGAWLANQPCRVKGIKGYIQPIPSMFALLMGRNDNELTGLE